MATPKKNTEQAINLSTKKAEQTSARITVFLRGTIKEKFFAEMERKGIRESLLGKEIISSHYSK